MADEDIDYHLAMEKHRQAEGQPLDVTKMPVIGVIEQLHQRVQTLKQLSANQENEIERLVKARERADEEYANTLNEYRRALEKRRQADENHQRLVETYQAMMRVQEAEIARSRADLKRVGIVLVTGEATDEDNVVAKAAAILVKKFRVAVQLNELQEKKQNEK